MPLGTFADILNRETKSNLFDAGKRSGFGELVSRASTSVDRIFEPVSNLTKQAGGAMFSTLFGDKYRETGESAGEALPRSLAELAPGGLTLKALGAASAGAKAYSDTGSVGAGLVAAGTTPFVGPAMHLGAKAVGTRVAAKTAEWSPRLGRLADIAGESFGANVTGAIIGEAQRQASSLAAGGGVQPIFTKEHGVEMIGTQLPFVGLDLLRAVRGTKPGEFRSNSERENALQFAKGELEDHLSALNAAVEAANKVRETARKDPGIPREEAAPKELEKVNAVVTAPVPHTDEQVVNTALAQVGPMKRRRLNIEDTFGHISEMTKDPAKAYTMIRPTERGAFPEFKAKFNAFLAQKEQARIESEKQKTSSTEKEDEYGSKVARLQTMVDKEQWDEADKYATALLTDEELPGDVVQAVEALVEQAVTRQVEAKKPKKHIAEQFELPGIETKKPGTETKKPDIDVSESDTRDPFSERVPYMKESGRLIKGVKTKIEIGTEEGKVPFSMERRAALGAKEKREKLRHEGTGATVDVVDTGSSLFVLNYEGDGSGQDVLLSRLMRRAKKEGKVLLTEEEDGPSQKYLESLGFVNKGENGFAWSPNQRVPFKKYELKRGLRETFHSSRGSSKDQLAAQMDMVLKPEDFPLSSDVETAAAQTARALDLLQESALLGMQPDILKGVRDQKKQMQAQIQNMVRQGMSPTEAIHAVYRSTMTKLRKSILERVEALDGVKPPKSFGVPEKTLQRAIEEWHKVPDHITMALAGLLDSASMHGLRANDKWADGAMDITMVAAHKFATDEAFRTNKVKDWEKVHPEALDALKANAEYYHMVSKQERSMLEIDPKSGALRPTHDKAAQERVMMADAVKSDTVEQTYKKLLEVETFRWVAAKWFGQTLRKMTLLSHQRERGITPEAEESGKVSVRNEENEGVTLSSLQDLKVEYLDQETFVENELKRTQNDIIAMVGNPSQIEIAAALKKMGKERLQHKTMVKLMRLVKAFYAGDVTVKYAEAGPDKGKLWYSYKGGNPEALAKLLSDEYSSLTPRAAQNFMAENVVPLFNTLWDTAETRRRAGRQAPYITQELTADVSAPFGLSEEVTNKLEKAGIAPEWFAHEEGATARDSFSIFATSFLEAGYDPARATLLATVAAKTAGVFRNVGKVHIGEVVGQAGVEVGGLAIHAKGFDQGLVLIKNPVDLGGSDLAVKLYNASRVLAHELFHTGSSDPVLGERYRKVVETASELPSEVRMNIIGKIAKEVMKGRGVKDTEGIFNQVMTNAGKSGGEFAADFASFVAMGKVGESVKAEIEHLPADVADSMKVFLADHKAIVEQVAKYHDLMPLPDDKVGKTIGQTVREMSTHLDEVLNSLDYVNEVSKGFALMNELSPGEFQHMLATNGSLPRVNSLGKLLGSFAADASVSDVIRGARRALGIEARREFERTAGVGPRFWEKLFPSAQFREAHPEIKPLLDLAYSFRGMTEDFYEKIMAPFTYDRAGNRTVDFLGRPKLDLGSHGVKEVLRDVDANELNTLIGLWKQEAEMTISDLRKNYPSEYARITKPFSKALIEAVEHFHEAVEKVQPEIARLMIDSTGKTISNVGAMALKGAGTSLSTYDVIDIADRAFKLYLEQQELMSAGAMGSPAGLANTAALTKIQGDVGMKAYMAMFRQFNAMHPEYQTVVGKLKDRPWYMTETRRGRYFVTWKDASNVPGVAGFDSLEQANRVIQQKQIQGFHVRAWEKTGLKPFSGADQDLVGAMAAVEKKAFEATLAALPNGTFKDQLRSSYVPLEAISKEYGSKGIAKYGMERNLAPGREYLNMAEGFFDQTQAMAFGLSRKNIKEQLALWQMDASIEQNPHLRDYTNGFVKNVLDPSGKEWVAFKKLNFVYFMGANVANMITETSQPLLIFSPYMTEKTGSMSAGPQYLWKASKMFLEALGNKVAAGVGKPMQWADPEVHKAVQQAYRERLLDFGIQEGIGAEQDSKITNLRRFAMDMNPLQKAAGFVMGPLHAYYDLVRKLYSITPRAGSHLTFVAAFEAARDGKIGGSKMNPDDAYSFAKQAVEATNFSGGTAARPMWFQGLGKLIGPVGAMYSLASYSASTLAMYARLAHDSVSLSKGLTTEQRKNAMKAFGQMTMSQFALAGAFGLPMTGATLAVLEKLFPDEEPRKALHEFLFNAGQHMFEDGGRFAAIAERGLVNGWSGVDLSSKLTLSNMMGINATDGFSFASAVGPTGAIMENVLKAFEDITKGNYQQGAVRLLPTAYQNIAKLAQNDGMVVDAMGRKVLEPSGQQRAMLALGFKPAELQEYYDQQKIVERAERVDEDRMRQFHTELAQSLLKGDISKVREELIKKVQEDPMYDVRWGARRIAQIAQEKTIPRDLYRTTNTRLAPELAALRGTYEQTQNRPSEVERVLARARLEQAIGVPGTGRPSIPEIREAARVDAQMSLDPRLTRMGALKLVQKRKPASSSLVQSFQ